MALLERVGVIAERTRIMDAAPAAAPKSRITAAIEKSAIAKARTASGESPGVEGHTAKSAAMKSTKITAMEAPEIASVEAAEATSVETTKPPTECNGTRSTKCQGCNHSGASQQYRGALLPMQKSLDHRGPLGCYLA